MNITQLNMNVFLSTQGTRIESEIDRITTVTMGHLKLYEENDHDNDIWLQQMQNWELTENVEEAIVGELHNKRNEVNQNEFQGKYYETISVGIPIYHPAWVA